MQLAMRVSLGLLITYTMPGIRIQGFPVSPRRRAVLGTVRVTTADLRAVGSEQAFSRNMIDLQPRAVGILEQHGVITRRITVLLGGVNDVGADLFQKIICFVDV